MIRQVQLPPPRQVYRHAFQRWVNCPVLKSNFESTVPGIYVAGELGGMGLIKNALTQGQQALEAIAKAGGKRPGALDVLIVGAGPAGFAPGCRRRNWTSVIRPWPCMRFIIQLGTFLAATQLAACLGGNGRAAGTGPVTPTLNTLVLTVDTGPAGATGAINHGYVTVKVCVAGSQTQCANIDHVLLDPEHPVGGEAGNAVDQRAVGTASRGRPRTGAGIIHDLHRQ
jgi:hypothetical protein